MFFDFIKDREFARLKSAKDRSMERCRVVVIEDELQFLNHFSWGKSSLERLRWEKEFQNFIEDGWKKSFLLLIQVRDVWQ